MLLLWNTVRLIAGTNSSNSIPWSTLNDHLHDFFQVMTSHWRRGVGDCSCCVCVCLSAQERGLAVTFVFHCKCLFSGKEWMIAIIAAVSAHYPPCLPHLFQILESDKRSALEIDAVSRGSFFCGLSATARLLGDQKLLKQLRAVMDEHISNIMAFLRVVGPAEKGVLDLMLLELYGREEGNPHVAQLVDEGLIEGYLKEACECMLARKSCSRSRIYDFAWFDVLVNISSVSAFAHRMVEAGYVDICLRMLAITKTDEASKQAALRGQGAVLEVLSHLASFSTLREPVAEALRGNDGPSFAKDRLEQFRQSSDARIRSGAQRFLFELGWSTGTMAPEEVRAKGPEAEAAYHKAMAAAWMSI